MKKLLILTALVSALMPIGVAQSVFDGTWKIDMSKANFSGKPDVIVIRNGMYECKSCTPPHTIKADGTDQPVPSDPYVDTLAVTIVSDHEIAVVQKKAGKVVATSRSIVTPDGKTRTFILSDSSGSNGGPPVVSKAQQTRIADGPAGSHLVSGTWQTEKVEASDNGILMSFKVAGDEIRFTSPTGQSYTAKLDGTDAPMKGDPGTTSVSVRMLGKDTLEETDKRNGEVISIFKFTVASDGKSATGINLDKLHNDTATFVLIKQ